MAGRWGTTLPGAGVPVSGQSATATCLTVVDVDVDVVDALDAELPHALSRRPATPTAAVVRANRRARVGLRDGREGAESGTRQVSHGGPAESRHWRACFTTVSLRGSKGEVVFKGFKNFLMQGDLIVIAVGLVVATAFSTLIKAFTDSIITPLVSALEGSSSSSPGLGWTINGQFVDVGTFISAIVYFIIFMVVIYFVLVVPYRTYMRKTGREVFSGPKPAAPVKTCPKCLSADLPVAATKCKYCGSDVE